VIQVNQNAKEITLQYNDLIVSKTDLRGKITYANRQFMQISDFSGEQLIGENHNMIRHPDMPRGVFYGLWETLKSGNEFFGFIKNITSSGNYYWVFANITPDVLHGKTQGYFSVRRHADPAAIKKIADVYKEMHRIEKTRSKETAAAESWKWLKALSTAEDFSCYDEYILSLYEENIKERL
jgi:PAS domain S-box-containing protein